MACRIVYAHDERNKHLEGKRFASHAAVARKLVEGTEVSVQELNGSNEGWYRQVGKTSLTKYWTSRPQTDY